jgi:hypothetical protein
MNTAGPRKTPPRVEAGLQTSVPELERGPGVRRSVLLFRGARRRPSAFLLTLERLLSDDSPRSVAFTTLAASLSFVPRLISRPSVDTRTPWTGRQG